MPEIVSKELVVPNYVTNGVATLENSIPSTETPEQRTAANFHLAFCKGLYEIGGLQVDKMYEIGGLQVENETKEMMKLSTQLVAEGFTSVHELTDLTESDLKELGVGKMAYRKKLLRLFKKLGGVSPEHGANNSSNTSAIINSDPSSSASSLGSTVVPNNSATAPQSLNGTAVPQSLNSSTSSLVISQHSAPIPARTIVSSTPIPTSMPACTTDQTLARNNQTPACSSTARVVESTSSQNTTKNASSGTLNASSATIAITNPSLISKIWNPEGRDFKLIRGQKDVYSRLEFAAREILECLGENPSRQGLVRTPFRIAKSILELTEGYEKTVPEIVGHGIFDEELSGEVNSNNLIVVKDIGFSSLCEHHLLPFNGTVAIGYVAGVREVNVTSKYHGNNSPNCPTNSNLSKESACPDISPEEEQQQGSGPNGAKQTKKIRRVLGLSKFARITDLFSKRLQLQERLNTQICDAVMDVVGAESVAVMIEASHQCMCARGVANPAAKTRTTAYRGKENTKLQDLVFHS